MAFLPVGCTVEQEGGNIKLAEMKDSSYWNSLFAVVGVQSRVLVTFSTDGKVLEIKVLHKAL